MSAGADRPTLLETGIEGLERLLNGTPAVAHGMTAEELSAVIIAARLSLQLMRTVTTLNVLETLRS